MRTILTLIFISLFVLCCSNAVYADETTAQAPDNFVTKLRSIADRMEVFPVDFIARKGPLCYHTYGSAYPDICLRTEFNFKNFRVFYDFCVLAMNASEKDIQSCIEVLKTEPPKVQALILTVIYVYAYPWSDELLKQPFGFYLAKRYWSWLAINAGCFDFNVGNRTPLTPEKRLLYKRIIQSYTANDNIAFEKLIEQTMETSQMKEYEQRVQRLLKIANSFGLQMLVNQEMSVRREYCIKLKESYPSEYHQMISDMLMWKVSEDFTEYPSSGPRIGFASAEPKTVGQIATQLLESWDPPPPFPRDELLLRHIKIPDEFKKLLPNPVE